ncbi:MAG: hypothetical protein IJ357_06865 [Oscillospiraceae bacterium]|nr:hypothetical protein [Oscillospiraceae bacterium]
MNMIDLTPYLPQQVPVERTQRRRRRFGSVAAALEAVVTLCIGAGLLLVLTAMAAAAIL